MCWRPALVYMSSLDFFQCVLTSISGHTDATAYYLYFQIPHCLFFQSWKCLSKYTPGEGNPRGYVRGSGRPGRHAESNSFEIHHPKPPLSVNLYCVSITIEDDTLSYLSTVVFGQVFYYFVRVGRGKVKISLFLLYPLGQWKLHNSLASKQFLKVMLKIFNIQYFKNFQFSDTFRPSVSV